MSSSFNWWEDDDDDDEKVAVESRLSQSFGVSQSAFRCEHCGGTDSYHDNTSGQDVCTVCFTQSQVNLTQEVDEDDINVLAARRGTALRAIRHSFGGVDGRTKAQGRLPLEPLDQSKPLPTLDICLEAMSCVLLQAARLFAIQMLHLNTIDDRAEYIQTVQMLWTRYLCAWMDGANELGHKFPQWRFSFRDLFLPATTRGLVMANLAYWSKKKVDEQQQKKGAWKKRIKVEDASEHDHRQVQPSVHFESTEAHGTNGPPEHAERAQTPAMKRLRPNQRSTPKKKPKKTIPTIERLIQSIRGRSDYKQAAMKLDPSMDLILAMLWLACSKSGITSFQACHWMMTRSPLLRAFELLPAELQEPHLERFFSIQTAPRPRTLEEIATLLAAACQMKTEGNWSFVHSEVMFHSPAAVPIMMAGMVANAGLDQAVLRRALGLLGLEENGTVPLPGVTLDHLSRTEDFLAVIAVACIMDPEWTSWSLRRSGKVNIPQNECHFAHLTNANVEQYLDFLDRQNLFARSRVWDGFENLAHLAQQQNGDDSESDSEEEEEPVRSHPVLADTSLTDDKEAQLHLLLGFLAYSVQGEVSRIRSTLAFMLNAKQKADAEAPAVPIEKVPRKRNRKKKAPIVE